MNKGRQGVTNVHVRSLVHVHILDSVEGKDEFEALLYGVYAPLSLVGLWGGKVSLAYVGDRHGGVG